ncbi:unnamed protein product [Pleuronectes platessa]|uniref:Uncharacterized protein n=1 Tax=Pleuronectes platessa TaxID=8262 RepID=A0A9N7VEF2_PLEPL|nr:unnamed protein product [Pleuronectes platessa]
MERHACVNQQRAQGREGCSRSSLQRRRERVGCGGKSICRAHQTAISRRVVTIFSEKKNSLSSPFEWVGG